MSSEPDSPETAPRLLIVGHVTRDLMADGSERLGGAASYAAMAAAALGIPAALVTLAPEREPLLATLRALPGVRLSVAPSPVMTTFGLDYSGPRRRLMLREVARPLAISDIPIAWREAPIVYAGGVAAECGRELLDAFTGAHVVAGVQGWLRRVADDGTVQPALLDEALDPPRALRVASLSEEDHPQAEALAATLARRGVITAVTRGARGVTVLLRDRRMDIPAEPAREVDPTGAGDVFALVFGMALFQGSTAEQAARRAVLAAARVVEGAGVGTLGRAG